LDSKHLASIKDTPYGACGDGEEKNFKFEKTLSFVRYFKPATGGENEDLRVRKQ